MTRIRTIVILTFAALAFLLSSWIFAYDLIRFGFDTLLFIRLIASIVLISIAAEDALTKHIHDLLLLALFLCGLAFFCASFFTSSLNLSSGKMLPATPMDCILGSVCVSVPMLIVSLIYRGSFGSGDILMCIGAGLMLGCEAMLRGTAIAMILAGALSALLLISNKLKPTDTIAFGPFLSVGFLIAMHIN